MDLQRVRCAGVLDRVVRDFSHVKDHKLSKEAKKARGLPFIQVGSVGEWSQSSRTVPLLTVIKAIQFEFGRTDGIPNNRCLQGEKEDI